MWRKLKDWLSGAAALVVVFCAVVFLGKRAARKDLEEANAAAERGARDAERATDKVLDAKTPEQMRAAGKAFVRKGP